MDGERGAGLALSEAAASAVGGVTDFGAGASTTRGTTEIRVPVSAGSCSAPQSVSISSVDGGVEGNALGGSLTVGRGGTDDALA